MKIYLKPTKIIATICIVAQIFIYMKITAFSISEYAENETINEQSESAAELMSNTSGIGSSNLTFSIIKPEIPLPQQPVLCLIQQT